MGRRKKPHSKQVQVNGQDPEVQEAIDAFQLAALKAFKARLDEVLKDGEDVKKLNLGKLMEQFRKLVTATKKPASSLNMINLPQAPQHREIPSARRYDDVASDPEERKRLREAGERFIERNPDGPA